MTERLDQALVRLGLATSRTRAARLVRAGAVRVDGVVRAKPGSVVDDAAQLTVDRDEPWVSRSAGKLVAALDAFRVDPSARVALDVGASTGGFTQVLLARGAAHVTAIDVGHGQFALPQDDRITVREGLHVRDIQPMEPRPDLVVADVSFISLRQVLPPVASVVTADADWIVLVKPQFEVGRTGVRQGIVTDAALRVQALRDVLHAAGELGLGTLGVIESPMLGTHGNHEYLAHLRAGPGDPTEWIRRIEREAR